jgi:hypothetical protein
MVKRRRWSWAGLLAVMAAVSLSMLPAMGQGPITEDVGLVRLHLGSDGDRFVFDPTAPGSDQVQILSETNCRLSSSGATLVSVVGSGAQANKHPYAGLKDHRLGVGQNGEGNGEPCARINKDLGQALTLGLTGALQGHSVGYAEIDLGFKFNGDAALELRRGGVLIDTVVVPCSGTSDCGPDSAGNDNERVILWLDPSDAPEPGHWQSFEIAGVFDTIVVKPGAAAVSGAVSLEGGHDGSAPGPLGADLGTNDTLFGLVEAFDGEIDCSETEILIESEDASFAITRGLDLDGGCKGPTTACYSASRPEPTAMSCSSTS